MDFWEIPGPTGGGGGVGVQRVRQIGGKLHARPYGPEQECRISGTLGFGQKGAQRGRDFTHNVGFWVGRFQSKGHFFYTLQQKVIKNRTATEDI